MDSRSGSSNSGRLSAVERKWRQYLLCSGHPEESSCCRQTAIRSPAGNRGRPQQTDRTQNDAPLSPVPLTRSLMKRCRKPAPTRPPRKTRGFPSSQTAATASPIPGNPAGRSGSHLRDENADKNLATAPFVKECRRTARRFGLGEAETPRGRLRRGWEQGWKKQRRRQSSTGRTGIVQEIRPGVCGRTQDKEDATDEEQLGRKRAAAEMWLLMEARRNAGSWEKLVLPDAEPHEKKVPTEERQARG